SYRRSLRRSLRRWSARRSWPRRQSWLEWPRSWPRCLLSRASAGAAKAKPSASARAADPRIRVAFITALRRKGVTGLSDTATELAPYRAGPAGSVHPPAGYAFEPDAQAL